MKKIFVLLFALVSVASAASVTLSGSVISDNQKMITSRFMGFVTEVNANEGDRVKKGDLLYTIDSKEIDSAKRQAEAGLQMYNNQYTNVKLNLDRHKKLYEKDMVAKYKVEELELAEKNLQDMITIAKARVQEVENQYKYLNIKAPNDGVIISKKIRVGEMAMPAMPAMILADLNDLKIIVEISEKDLKKVAYDKKVSVEIPSVGLKGVGKVSAIIPSSNPMTHTFKVKVSFKSNHFKVYPGMYAIVKL